MPVSIPKGRRQTAARVLKKLGYLKRSDPLPDPHRVASGVRGVSAVYFFSLPRDGTTQDLVLKFDDPKRAATEWNVVRRLQRQNVPKYVLLPISGQNTSGDGVIVYEDVAGISPGEETWELAKLLEQQIAANWQCCERALDFTWSALEGFHLNEPGALRVRKASSSNRWRGFFPQIGNKRTKLIAAKHAKHWSALPKGLPDPLPELAAMLERRPGRIMLSRVHGDLNLHNVLINLNGKAEPVDRMIIDLASCTAEMPTALDFARVETELWHEVYGALQAEEQDLLEAFVASRHWLDGREKTLILPKGVPASQHFVRIVCAIRGQARQRLVGGQSDYLLKDYFQVLYLQHMLALSYETVTGTKARLALLAAASSLQFLQDLEAGRYAPGADQPLTLPDYSAKDLPSTAVPSARDRGTGKKQNSATGNVSVAVSTPPPRTETQKSSPTKKDDRLIALFDPVIAATPEELQSSLEDLRALAQRGERVNLVDIVARCCMILENVHSSRKATKKPFGPPALALIRHQALRVAEEIRSAPSMPPLVPGEVGVLPVLTPIMLEILMAQRQLTRNPQPEFRGDGDLTGVAASTGCWETGPRPDDAIAAFETALWAVVMGGETSAYRPCQRTPCGLVTCQSPLTCSRRKLHGYLGARMKEGKQRYALVQKRREGMWSEIATNFPSIVFAVPGESAAHTIEIDEFELADLITKFHNLTEPLRRNVR